VTESAVTDLANDLKDRFDWAMYQSQEAYVVLPDGKSFERVNETSPPFIPAGFSCFVGSPAFLLDLHNKIWETTKWQPVL
jgi:hypothetical protein